MTNESWLKILAMAALCSLNAEAKDFGQMGNIFAIKEEGFIQMLSRKLKNIDIETHKEAMINYTKKAIEEPAPLLGIIKTTQEKRFIYDPTYVVKEDISLPNGDILYKAGTKVNPLDYMDFDRKMFFLDGRDNKQLEWLKIELNNSAATKEKRVILVAGRPLDLSNELSIDVYFDQFGELTKKFGITQVPASVEQHESQKILIVKEMKCDE